MSEEKEIERLSQKKMLELIRHDAPVTEMLTVYYHNEDNAFDHNIYCAFVPKKKAQQILKSTDWDLKLYEGLPGCVVNYKNGEKQVRYRRFSNDSSIEPLIIARNFNQMRPSYFEISEEFRLFHELYHDKKTEQYIKFDDDGNESIIVISQKDCIKIRLKEIRQFLAIREMFLMIQFDCREYSSFSLKELGFKRGCTKNRESEVCWGLTYSDINCSGGRRFLSRLLGKRLIPPLPKEKITLFGYNEQEEMYAEFIIGVNEFGDEIKYSCNPDVLETIFDPNSGSDSDSESESDSEPPGYLTPVHFRKQVLDKYYSQSTKYKVDDSLLSCGALWCLQIDNHHDDKVIVWLGDLGRELSFTEQLHWKSYNIPPQGCISDTYFKRQILAAFTESNRCEHLFAQKYEELHLNCVRDLSWQILLSLDPGDAHYLKSIRIPATDEQREFDELILGLTKILIDSLNVEGLKKLIPDENRLKIEGSINQLEAALVAKGVTGFDVHIKFLRNLQSLRSSSIAHRKGKKSHEVATVVGLDCRSHRLVFTEMLENAVKFLTFLTDATGCLMTH